MLTAQVVYFADNRLRQVYKEKKSTESNFSLKKKPTVFYVENEHIEGIGGGYVLLQE